MTNRCKFARPFASALLLLLSSSGARAETVTDFLRAFHADPAKTMERLPDVVDDHGEAQPSGYLTDEMKSTRIRNLVSARAGLAPASFQDINTAEPLPNDDVANLLEPGTGIERNLGKMQSQKLNNLTAAVKPWADSYWPTYRGQTAFRYADVERGTSKIWSENYAFFQSRPTSAIVADGDAARINLLAPAEKYDFVMGDTDFTLTKFAWEQGRKSSDGADGGVATWMGICHGWSAASSMGSPFIGQSTTVVSASGVPVTFYPQDIKALQSMLWANAAPRARFISGRCKDGPRRNGNGRDTNPDCFDTNPATWHLAVVNQLGKNGRSFVFDGDPGAEVWNFPLQSAHYRYFNPQTFEEAQTWTAAKTPLSRFTVDKFKEFRSTKAVSVVGIYMDVTYPIEIEPGVTRIFDAPTKTVRYVYDLELDGNDDVIGGEWYTRTHPDFLWTFDKGAQAMSPDETALNDDPWKNAGPVPANWTPYAKRASARGIPLHNFIQRVIDAAGPVHQP